MSGLRAASAEGVEVEVRDDGRGLSAHEEAAAEGEAKGLRLALEEAPRPFWRRWLG
jgi:hypothetical protein